MKGPEGNIACQVFGDGPIDLVIVPGWLSPSSCTARTRRSRSSTRAKSPRESRRRESSNSKASITGRPSATSSRSPARSRNSSPGSGTSTYPTGCWPPCCLPTSSIRRGMPRGSGTAVGASCSHATTTSPTPKSAVSKGVSYSTPATVSRGVRRPDARPSVCDHGRGADAGFGYRCAMWSAHRRV